jgi:hypothetical protein
VLAVALALVVPIDATPVRAGDCGDAVDGMRVACSCGDVVVSDTRLRADDPVVTERCRTDGLIVRAPAGATSLHLDLGGQALTGQGLGTGIRVFAGGSRGAVIVGGPADTPGTIANFRTGLRTLNGRVLSEVRNLRLLGNARDGARIRVDGAVVAGIAAEKNGRDGVRVLGRSATLEGVDAVGNAGYGVVALGREAILDAGTLANLQAGAAATQSARANAETADGADDDTGATEGSQDGGPETAAMLGGPETAAMLGASANARGNLRMRVKARP